VHASAGARAASRRRIFSRRREQFLNVEKPALANPAYAAIFPARLDMAHNLHNGSGMVNDALLWLEATSLAVWVRESSSIWAYPTVLTMHTIGLAVLVGASTALDLRLLGVAKAIPLTVFAGSFRVIWIGFWINAISGLVLYTTEASTKGATAIFAWKLGIILLCVVNIALIRRVVYGRADEAPSAGITARLLAGSSLVLWSIAIALGRWMAYA
jgi:hypothetical protein